MKAISWNRLLSHLEETGEIGQSLSFSLFSAFSFLGAKSLRIDTYPLFINFVFFCSASV